ncbi:hypothetical protein L1987_06974 [Smallanthus sonchifolius]|uniref:Uncharacterized protein n=1 Tax=Smallanthus sonchifolius TaxID=185202 RepID=A0ACB9JZZ7_9ASTR|nr:hypothetical protein L1987_06974 [Smallanthus sonchifolius]
MGERVCSTTRFPIWLISKTFGDDYTHSQVSDMVHYQILQGAAHKLTFDSGWRFVEREIDLLKFKSKYRSYRKEEK